MALSQTKILDTHVHFWRYNASHQDFAWIDNSMQVLKTDYFPQQLIAENLFLKNSIGCIAVQARCSIAETDFLIGLANTNQCIKGVVGWLDWDDKKLDSNIERYSQINILKGFRHIIQDLPTEVFQNKNFSKFISKIENRFTYDLLIKPHQLESAYEFVKKFPNQKFIINHIAKPNLLNHDMFDWKQKISRFSDLENVYCKLSGMVTEAEFFKWTTETFKEVIEHVIYAFGIERLMLGSDWPVCLLSASYDEVFQLVNHYFQAYSDTEKQKIFYQNGAKFYNI